MVGVFQHQKEVIVRGIVVHREGRVKGGSKVVALGVGVRQGNHIQVTAILSKRQRVNCGN
jgi:hypothetical protein